MHIIRGWEISGHNLIQSTCFSYISQAFSLHFLFVASSVSKISVSQRFTFEQMPKDVHLLHFLFQLHSVFGRFNSKNLLKQNGLIHFLNFNFESFPGRKIIEHHTKSNYFCEELNSKRIFVYWNLFQVSFNWKKPPSPFPNTTVYLKNGCFFLSGFFWTSKNFTHQNGNPPAAATTKKGSFGHHFSWRLWWRCGSSTHRGSGGNFWGRFFSGSVGLGPLGGLDSLDQWLFLVPLIGGIGTI